MSDDRTPDGRAPIDRMVFSPAEMAASEALVVAANLIRALPPVHPCDAEEASRDIHNLQNRLLARCAYEMRYRV